MSEKEEHWEKRMREMLKPLGDSLGRVSSDLNDLKQKQNQSLPPSSSEGEPDMPIYKCKGKGCTFATDDLDAYVDHKIAHSKEELVEEETPPKPQRRHRSVDEFLSCPECRPRFDQRYLKDGWTPPKKEPQKEEKPEKRKKSGELEI